LNLWYNDANERPEPTEYRADERQIQGSTMAELAQTTITVTRQDIVRGLAPLGLGAGGDVLAHSSLSSFGYVQGGADAVIDALLKTVGPTGTVLVPTLTGSEELNVENPPIFDPDATSCWTGRIPEVFRQRPNARRSHHPTHSVAAIGARAQDLTRDHEFSITPCGPDSPYGRLAQTGGQILLLGVTHSVNTTFHHVEEIVGVPYHMQPGWVAAQVKTDDRAQTIHLMIHRYGPERRFERMEPVFRERGIQRDGQIGQAHVRLIDARRMVEITRQALLQDPTILLA
jgi:aminoglycoside 3-N-acetyltransferase